MAGRLSEVRFPACRKSMGEHDTKFPHVEIRVFLLHQMISMYKARASPARPR